MRQYVKILILMLILSNLSILANVRPTDATTDTKVFVEPSVVEKPIGDSFTLNINISDVTNLYGFDISFWWDATLLSWQTHKVTVPVETYPGGILHKPVWALPGLPLQGKLNTTAGTFRVGYLSYGTAATFNGSGRVFWVTFKVLREGACYLHLSKHELSDKSIPAQPIPHEAQDGEFRTPGAGYAPFANFTYSPKKIFVGKTTVTFDGSGSNDSRDPGGYITKFMWDFGDGTKITTNDPVTTHVYPSLGTQSGLFYPTLSVEDYNGSRSYPVSDVLSVIEYSDVKMEKITVSPTTLPRGLNATIDVTVSNIGITGVLPFNVTTYYNKTAVDWGNIMATDWAEIEEQRVSSLPKGTNKTLTFNWNTKPVPSDKYYFIMANTSDIENDVDLDNNAVVSDTFIYVMPGYPIADFVFSPIPVVNEPVILDARASFDPDGTITEYRWDFGDGVETNSTNPIITHAYHVPGTYKVTLTVVDDDPGHLKTSATKWIDIAMHYVLDITIDVGTIHFREEMFEFYVLTSKSGERLNANLTAVLYYANGTSSIDLSKPVYLQRIATGLYRIAYTLPATAPDGTYTLVVEASYLDFLKGNALRSFLVSGTMSGWNPLLVSINGTVATIKTDVGPIQMNLRDINATLTDIIVDSNGEVLVKIDSSVGTIMAELDAVNATLVDIIIDSNGEVLAKINATLGTMLETITTKLDAINAKVVEVDGNVITLQTDVGTIRTTVGEAQSAATIPLYVVTVFSAVAAVVTIVILLILRKKPT